MYMTKLTDGVKMTILLERNTKMMASYLVKILQKIIDEKGDLPVLSINDDSIDRATVVQKDTYVKEEHKAQERFIKLC